MVQSAQSCPSETRRPVSQHSSHATRKERVESSGVVFLPRVFSVKGCWGGTSGAGGGGGGGDGGGGAVTVTSSGAATSILPRVSFSSMAARIHSTGVTPSPLAAVRT